MRSIRKPICLILSLILAMTAFISAVGTPAYGAGVEPEDGQIYYIKNKHSGLYLQVENDAAKDGANVCQAIGTGSLGQKWIVNENSDGSFRLKSAVDMTGGIALDIPNGIPDNLANVQVWSSNGLTPQNFKAEASGDGSYAILTAASGYARCLDVLDWSTEDGANVIQYDCFMADNQLWYFEKASWPSGSGTSQEETTETTTAAITSSSTSWNMSNSSFRNLGTISSDVSVEGIKLHATSAKTMEVKAEEVSVNGYDFTYCLALGGGGSTDYRSLSTNISGTSTVKITARSSGTSVRTLNIADKNGKVLGTVSCGSQAALGSVTLDYSGEIYIYSAGSGINIFKVQIDSKGGTVETTTEAATKQTTTKKETTTETTTKAQTASSKSWNMSNSNFKGLGTLSSNVTVDGLTLLANSSKTMQVKAENASVDGNDFTYCLALGGGGSASYRAVALDISGKSNIKITARSSGTSERTLNVADANGNILGTVSCGSTAALGNVFTEYSGKVYIYSAGSGINIYKIQLDTTGSLPGGSSGSSETKTEATTSAAITTTKANESTGSGTTVTNYSGLLSAVKNLSSKGGTIYVNAKELNCTEQLKLNSTSGKTISIIGVKQSDGTYPVLNFKPMRDSMIGTKAGSLSASGDSAVGVRITGSNYVIKNIIIEKAGDNGIQIKGSSANNNTVENCIVRYNNDAGLQITNGASYNTIKFVYSYRNCDVYSLGGNADGFAPKLGASTGNTFYGCYAWDNSDDGWDSYDKTDSGYTKDLSYEWCACWNNGNPDVFTGAYDFEQGNSLDTDLFLVELIMRENSSFASNYKSGKLSLPTSKFLKTSAGTIALSSWTGSNYDGNPNGFKFGSAYSDKNSTRTVKNCLAFDHGKKGFDNNNSALKGSFADCVAFDNGYNYYLPNYSLSKWSSIVGFDGNSSDKLPSGYSASAPSSSQESSIRSKVESTRKSIVSKCNSDIIPGEVYFDIF